MSMRRALVIVQFVISQVFIIGTIVAGQQMDLFLGNDIGFDKEAIIMTKNPGGSVEKLQSFKNAIASKPGVEMVSFGVASPMSPFRVSSPITHPNIRKEDQVDANLKTADENYIELYHLKLIAGRNLPEEKDTKDAVVSRKLTKTLGHDSPESALGDTFKYSDDLEFRIIGVVEDFHSVSFHYPLENVILSNFPWNIHTMAIKLDGSRKKFSDIQSTINDIKREWDTMYPETIFDYTFLDDQIGQLYRNEQKTSQLFQIFSIVAIFIGCLGLYGLVSYMANQKVKEIGIRKVLGASIPNIIGIFSKEMFVLVLIAFAVSVPLAWYVMNNWLQEFEYRVSMSPVFFILALFVSLLIAFATTGYKAITASSANPVDSLRSE
jgi:ABC-type antimicrobial peptide transport system permease subunit